MGIRYLATPLSPLDVDEAKACTRCYLMRDPFPHGGGCHRGLTGERDRPEGLPRYLDLDKCWVELSNLLSAPPFATNPARSLVEGNVRHTSDGWIPYYAVLDPIRVVAVAAGLSEITAEEVGANIDHFARSHETPQQTESYVLQFLGAAQQFTRDLASVGFRLVYVIG